MIYPVAVRTARGFAAASRPHELSTQTAMKVIQAGGNAVDGAIAANAVQGVVAPETSGVGGDLFALLYLPGSTSPPMPQRVGESRFGRRRRDAP